MAASSPPPSGSGRGARRLAALRQYDILDTPPEEAFDRITRLTSDLLDTPMALINLIADDRQWFKSSIGFDRRETGLDISFCVHALHSDDVTVIEDTAADERVADNPLVTDDPELRFYAGAPLVTPEGIRIGTLCVLDTEPRSLSDTEVARLQDLSAMVIDELELRRTRTEAETQRDLLRRTQQVAQVGGWEYDPQTDTAQGTEELYRIIGLPEEDFALDTGLDLYAPEARPKVQSAIETCIAEGTPFDLEVPFTSADGTHRYVRVRGAAEQEDGETVRLTGILQDVTEMEAVRLRRLGYAVTPCDSPQDALQAFDETPDAFDIVVTDFSMPSMNGLTLTRKLRDRGCTAPIVLMSGFSAQVSQDDVQSTGVSTFLRKPVGGDELAQVLARLLAS